MTEDETKIKLIQVELEKHGLTLDDEEVVNFFLRKRAVYTGTLIKGNTTYVYSNLIRPQKMHLHIASFENCGYAMPEIDTMEKWYLYKNASDNPLVFANMDNYSNDILDAFKHAREKGGPVKCDVNGKLFNGEDGNHRLLLLIIHDFIERHSAKTAEEIERVNEKYSMDVEVDFMHDREVIEAIENRCAYLSSLNKESPYSLSARKYKEFVGFRTEEKIYCAEYSNPIYHYNFNGENFDGNGKELMNYLANKKPNPDIMQWKSGEYYYVAYGSKICKSKDETKLKGFATKMMEQAKVDDTYSVIYDVETNKYEIFIPELLIDVRDADIEKIAQNYKDLCNNPKYSYMFKNCNLKQDDIIGACDSVLLGGNLNLYIPGRHYTNLTKEEFLALRDNLENEYIYLNKKDNITV